MGTVHDFPQDRVRRVNGNGGDDGIRYRLLSVEEDVREIKQDLKSINNRLHSVEGNLKVIKTELSHVASREDIQKLATDVEAKLSKQLKWLLTTASVFFVGSVGVIVRLLALVITS